MIQYSGELLKGLIQNLKAKAYRNAAYLAWLNKGHKCFCCPSIGSYEEPITASHIFRGYHGLKNHDWACVPMCGYCHWLYEFHRSKFTTDGFHIPAATDAERYFQRFLKETERKDNRTR